MAEEMDWSLLLETAPAEERRALESAASERRQAAAYRARAQSLAGNAAARRDLTRRWAAVDKDARDPAAMSRVIVFSGEGPPTDPPQTVPVGAFYVDTLTDQLYRLEA